MATSASHRSSFFESDGDVVVVQVGTLGASNGWGVFIQMDGFTGLWRRNDAKQAGFSVARHGRGCRGEFRVLFHDLQRRMPIVDLVRWIDVRETVNARQRPALRLISGTPVPAQPESEAVTPRLKPRVAPSMREPESGFSEQPSRTQSSRSRSHVANGVVMGQSHAYAKAIRTTLAEGAKAMNDVGRQWRNVSRDRLAGRLAETDHAWTFNADAAFKRSNARAKVLHSNGKNSPDIEVRHASGQRTNYSSKVYKGAKETAAAQRGYGDQVRLNPKDQNTGVRQHASRRAKVEDAKGRSGVGREWREVESRSVDHIESGKVKSQARTREESLEKADKARQVKVQESDVVGNDWKGRVRDGANGGAKAGAKAAAVISSATEAYQAYRSVRDGRKTVGEAAWDATRNVALNTVEGAFKGYVGGAATAGAQVLATRVSQPLLKRALGSSLPATAALIAVDVGHSTYKLATGSIDSAEYGEEVKDAVCNGTLTAAGAAIGSVFGPVGAVVGGIAVPMIVTKLGEWFDW